MKEIAFGYKYKLAKVRTKLEVRMEKIPEYCKVGFVVSLFTVVNAAAFGFMATNPISAPVLLLSKVYLVGFPTFGLCLTGKKMYDYHFGYREFPIPQHHQD